ncbi:MAG: multiheme c-type cytochrome [Planctomycetota bacterium]
MSEWRMLQNRTHFHLFLRFTLCFMLAVSCGCPGSTGDGGNGDGGNVNGNDVNGNDVNGNDVNGNDGDDGIGNDIVDNNDNDNDNDNDDGNGNANDNGTDDPVISVSGKDLSTYQTTSFSGAGNCALCHNDLADTSGKDVSIANDWRATMMANAAKDPFFLANVEAEVNVAPHLAAVIEETCSNCHMPVAYMQALAEEKAAMIFEDGFLNADNELHGPAMEGVSCTLCHQIQDTFIDNPDKSISGNFDIDTSTRSPNRIIFGPFEDPQVPQVMESAVGYRPEFGAHMLDSAVCATCHSLVTPTLDAEGNIVGEFPEQTPYEEWLASDFGDGVGNDDQSCQDCHMPVTEEPAIISRVPANLDPREPFYSHVFRGGNVTMLKLLRDNIDELDLSASTEQFNDQVRLTEAFLRNETATISMERQVLQDGTLELDLLVTNLAGHKLPTSFPSRRVWIHLVVNDADGATVFESGGYRDDGSIVGADADEDAAAFEPHHDVITEQSQVQIYEPIMRNTDGDVTYILLRAATYAKNNRLLPAGLSKQEAMDAGDIAVAGGATSDDDFVAGSDQVRYAIDTMGHSGPFTVTAKLLYQSISFRFAEELVAEEGEQIDRFRKLFDAADKAPSLIAEATTTIQ